MRQRRVGTISMGILLMGLGIILVYARINMFDSLTVVLKWWPILFFLLGAEVLIYTYLAKNENPSIKYDIFSIFIVLIIVASGIGLYSISEIGLADKLTMLVSAENYSLQLPDEEVRLESSIKKIIIDAPHLSKLVIRSNGEDILASCGTAYVTADSKQNAEKMLQDKIINTRKIGDTLYVNFNQALSNNGMVYNYRLTECTLFIPTNREVEINSNSDLKLDVNELRSNWSINSTGSTEIRLADNTDVAIKALVNAERDLGGNVQWDISKVSEGTKNKQDEERGKYTVGSIVNGKGSYKVGIISRGNVRVNRI